MPDLSLDLESMDGTVDIQDVPFGEDSCALLEGCVDAPGVRRVLRFTTTTPNTGTADVFFGDVTRGDLAMLTLDVLGNPMRTNRIFHAFDPTFKMERPLPTGPIGPGTKGH